MNSILGYRETIIGDQIEGCILTDSLTVHGQKCYRFVCFFAKMNVMMCRMYREYVQLNMSNTGIDHVDHVVCRWDCAMRYMKGSAVEQNIKRVDTVSI